ncbi:MAG: hypothetical protein V4472_23965 [Pseudomonadota bacterium]
MATHPALTPPLVWANAGEALKKKKAADITARRNNIVMFSPLLESFYINHADARYQRGTLQRNHSESK